MPDFQTVIASPVAAYDEGLRFFAGQGMINNTLHRVTADLAKHGIDYTVIGAVALNQHGYRRFTEDIDLLLTREGLDKFEENLVESAKGYISGVRRCIFPYHHASRGRRKRFRRRGGFAVSVFVTGEYPGDGLPKPVRFPDPKDVSVEIDGVKTITLEKLIELKLASGISAPHRLKDLADVLELIRVKRLNADFATQLDETVRAKFLELHRVAETSGEESDESW